MSEVVLDRPRVVAVIRQLVTARVTQHVRMDRKRDLCPSASPSDDFANRRGRKRPISLRDENVGRFRVDPLQASQGTNFLFSERMVGGCAVLYTADVQQSACEIDWSQRRATSSETRSPCR